MVKPGQKITRRIPMRSYVNCLDAFVQLFNSVRHANEDLVSSRVVDSDTIEVITVIKKLEVLRNGKH